MSGLRAFELRLTTLGGGIRRLQISTTQAEADALTRRYLTHGQAVRVELWGWRYHRWELVGDVGSAAGSPTRTGPRDA